MTSVSSCIFNHNAHTTYLAACFSQAMETLEKSPSSGKWLHSSLLRPLFSFRQHPVQSLLPEVAAASPLKRDPEASVSLALIWRHCEPHNSIRWNPACISPDVPQLQPLCVRGPLRPLSLPQRGQVGVPEQSHQVGEEHPELPGERYRWRYQEEQPSQSRPPHPLFYFLSFSLYPAQCQTQQ